MKPVTEMMMRIVLRKIASATHPAEIYNWWKNGGGRIRGPLTVRTPYGDAAAISDDDVQRVRCAMEKRLEKLSS